MKITNPYEYKPLERTKGKQGRLYVVGESRPLPSVTTILSKTSDKTGILEWRQRVGEEEANKIVKQATDIGDRLHKNLEDYILIDKKPEGNMLTRILTQMIIKQGLSKVDEVWGCEVNLYAKDLFAGTSDLVGVHQGVPAIMDFKNSRKFKKREWVTDYFLQSVAYAEAHNEMYNTTINKGVVMIACRTGQYVEYIIEGEEFDQYRTMWYDKLYQYYDTYGLD